MGKWIIIVITVICLWISGYYLGRSHAEIKIVKEQVEVGKYVEKKKSEIAARPNASRNDLLELMRQNKL